MCTSIVTPCIYDKHLTDKAINLKFISPGLKALLDNRGFSLPLIIDMFDY